MSSIRNFAVLGLGAWGLAFGAIAQTPHGHHGAGGHFGDPLAAIAGVKAQLNLNTSQQQQWDALVTQGQSARESARANFAQVRTAMQTELAKSEPDLASVAAVSDSVEQQNGALRKQVRSGWLSLYATFTPQQKTVVRDAINAKFDKMAAFRARMQAAHGG